MKSAVALKCFSAVGEIRVWRAGLGAAAVPGEKAVLGFVPTMGALHDGHMALVRRAAEQCQNVIVSIFVNPLQFGANEDLDKYPRTLEADIELCKQAGVQAVFHPGVAEMYPQGRVGTTTVLPPADLIERLCGLFRPGHFVGVATVVTKLFSQVQPELAFFGEKDFQQLAVIRRMVEDLNLPVGIVGVQTVRESDGLALSSRNVYLSPEQRRLAPTLYQTLCFVRDQVRTHNAPVSQSLGEGKQRISALPGVTLQYLESCDPETLRPVTTGDVPIVILVAAKFGEVRLIDNLSF